MDIFIGPATYDGLSTLSSDGRKTDEVSLRARPFKATDSDEYQLVRETSNDFMSLRRKLIASPAQRLSPDPATGKLDGASFEGSIFQTIFDDKKTDLDNQLLTKSGASLMHLDDERNGDSNSISSAYINDMARGHSVKSNIRDPWNRFNSVLLNYLNDYLSQVKDIEEKEDMNLYQPNYSTREMRDIRSHQRPNRRSSAQNPSQTSAEFRGSKNLLTFACLAQDGNPLSNLTFDWSFGTMKLPSNVGDANLSKASRQTIQEAIEPSIRGDQRGPFLVYANENFTVHMAIFKRHDTGPTLNPFKMSLLTVNVFVLPSTSLGSNHVTPSSSIKSTIESRDTSMSEHHASLLDGSTPKTQLLKTKYQQTRAVGQAPNDGVQFANEYGAEIKPMGSGNWDSLIESNEKNWLEQIDHSLKCSITNQIGSSEVCHVRVNVAERLKTRQTSSSEFAKWRMPTLGHRSILIITILIGCALTIFLVSALLAGPYLRGLAQLKKDPNGPDNQQVSNQARRHETNTGQSSCSQKSSMLGLLSSTGDSSFQGSSDDDSSARLNHLDTNRITVPENSATSSHTYHHHQHPLHDQRLIGESELNYDQPKPTIQYSATNPTGYVETNQQSSLPSSKLGASGLPISKKGILGNLSFKSLSKFKVDRISDISNLASKMDNFRSFYGKTASSSETNTTGLSPNCMNSETSIKKTSPTSTESSAFFELPSHQQSSSMQTRARDNLGNSYYLFNQNGLQNESDPQTIQLNTQMLSPNSLMPTYSNLMNYHDVPNPLDEFIRQREVGTPMESNNDQPFFRSQSVRNHHLSGNPMYQFYPALINRGPPVFPRTHNTTTLYGTSINQVPQLPTRVPAQRPPMTPSFGAHTYSTTLNQRMSMPQYDRSYGFRETPYMSQFNHRDTIDSHLNRMTDNVVLGQYANHQDRFSNNDITPYSGINNQSTEHIYAVNAYATPENTPIRRRNSLSLNQPQTDRRERPSVSQLVQTFTSQGV